MRLGGASTKAPSKADVLRAAEAQRAARLAARRSQHAAQAIQAAWRGAAARSRLRDARLAEWLQRYAGASAPEAQVLSAAEVGRAAALLLAALLPPPGSAARRRVEAGAPLATVQQRSAQRRAVAALAALVTRALKAAPREVQQRLAPQASRLCMLLCAAIAAGPTPDQVLDAAAARALELLLAPPSDPAQNAGWGESSVAVSERGGSALQALLVTAAARRVAERAVAGGGQSAGSSSGGDRSGGQGQLASAISDTTVLSRLVNLARALAGGQLEDSPQGQQQQDEAASLLARHLLPAPGLVAVLPEPVAAQLLRPASLAPLLRAAGALAADCKLRGTSAAAALGNLAHLLLAPPGQLPSCGASSLLKLPMSPHLAQPAVAAAFCDALMRLLPAAAAGSSAQPQLSGAQAAAVGAQLALLGAQAPLLQLLSVLGDDAPRFAGAALHLLRDQPAAAAAVARAATPPAAATAAAEAAPARAAEAGAEGGWRSAQEEGGGDDAAAGTPALNALAFAPSVLPALWRWLSTSVGLPLEAPAAARLGCDVAAVSGGARSLAGEHALVLGVFCRALCQLLLVLSDDDLHRRGTPFNTGAARAIATTLNALVYHTHFPAAQARGRQQGPAAGGAGGVPALPAATLSGGRALLERHAPQALRGLYERDQRRPFCRPELWTAPFDADRAAGAPHTASIGGGAAQPQAEGGGAGQGRGQGGLGAVAAVVQGLLFTGRPTAAAAAGAASAAAAAAPLQPTYGTPAALTALLRSAPQCVPFDVRLQLFRHLLAEDRARGRWDANPAEGGPRPLRLTVRRGRLLEDAYGALAAKGAALKGRLYVTFVSASGVPEAGLDHGGLTKELLEGAVGAAASPGYGLFAASDSGLAYPSPTAAAIPGGFALLEFVGLLVGKALYDGLLLPDLALAPHAVVALQGGAPRADDLAAVDPTLAAGLAAVASYEGDLADLGLTFSVEFEDLGRRGRLTPLRTDAASDPPHTVYGNGYSESSRAVRMFWEVVREFGAAQRAALLRFVTSSSRPPLGGFRHLHPPFTVHRVDVAPRNPLAALMGGRGDVELLPTASTCFCMLKLPQYASKRTLREKLLYSITSGAGFELS
ncbi:hypothetical protein Rsub_09986 [Raphidocelis subcapitata]|uniref:HECT-type E3 ubiquitin transferase n=1 Tax=Raphidocelis subcapitata TaxID=307507 RepID=A0A2V0PJS6_9CHLO|nr:hypothetical protein Rsub_09986 [Raphidocelis subcapitata]|eukprot:GBF97295.1 hypothetical protein Rsub_09986 [Raphidocelis subcapitata]